MSGVRLTLRNPLPARVNLADLNPSQLAYMGLEEISRIPLRLGNRLVTVEALFEVATCPGDPSLLEIHGADGRLDGIATGMSGGEVKIIGDAGNHLGQELQGGRIRVQGNCGGLAAAGMESGEIIIEGNAGDRTGAALPGHRRGLKGGAVTIHGYAGARTGERMRRGFMAIQGGAGKGTGAYMVAGTLVVLGGTGPGAGFGMRRGTLVVDRPFEAPSTFNDNGELDLDFLALLRQELEKLAPAMAGGLPSHHRVQRWVGDIAVGGLGEILLWR